MKKLCFMLFVLCLNTAVYAEAGQAYLDKFMLFSKWYQQLPLSPNAEFLAFIDNHTPLANKLRDKWLYELARTKDWATYKKYYQYSTDPNLQCYALVALYDQGPHQLAVQSAQTLWLNGNSQPKACDELFTVMLKNKEIDENLIHQRLLLALDNRNISLAIYLLKQYASPLIDDAKLLTTISQNPRRISQLKPSPLHSEFYLYGLKRMVSINMKDALQLWDQAQAIHLLSNAQQQAFLAHIALYKAVRNQPDAPAWFAKVQPAFYNDVLLGWQIRYDLKYRQWHDVEALIDKLQDKDSPCWQYWLARSLEAQGQQERANTIYQNLAVSRQYYGFLSSRRLNKRFSFENERAVENTKNLHVYRPITDQIKSLYASKQVLQASRLINDFASELPKDDKSAFVYWLATDLQWHGKSVYLSNTDELNNQLSLRFPLPYQKAVVNYAKNYQIPQALIYAIIRQESGFRDDVVSSAGAQGLMQVMPATARAVSKTGKIAYSDKKELFSSQKNINIGTAYLQQLGKRFSQHPLLMVAAYNAGPRQAAHWWKTHPPKDIDIWIETLPWYETRNYIKNVIAFYAVYQYRTQQKSDLSPFMNELL